MSSGSVRCTTSYSSSSSTLEEDKKSTLLLSSPFDPKSASLSVVSAKKLTSSICSNNSYDYDYDISSETGTDDQKSHFQRVSRENERRILLHSILVKVNFLVDISAAAQSVFFISSSGVLNVVSSALKSILIHGVQIQNYYLIFSQDSFETFDFWLKNSILDFTIITYLEKHQERIRNFYYDWAFMNNVGYYEYLLNILYFMSTKDYYKFYHFTLNHQKNSTSIFHQSSPFYFSPWTVKKDIEVLCSSSKSKTDQDQDQMAQKANCASEIEQYSAKGRPIDIIINKSKLLLPQTRTSLHQRDFNIQQDQEQEDSEVDFDESISISRKTLPPPDFSYNHSSYGSPSPIAQIFSSSTTPSTSKNISPGSASTTTITTARRVIESLSLQAEHSINYLPQVQDQNFISEKKSFLESGGLGFNPTAFGNFPKPKRGQSLTSFLIDSLLSEQMPELDRENAHMHVSEALISAFERVKIEQCKKTDSENEERAEKIDSFSNRYDLPGHSSEKFPFSLSENKSIRSKMNFKDFRTCRPKSIYNRPIHTETEESEFEYWKDYRSRKPPTSLLKKRKNRALKMSLGSDGQSVSASAEDNFNCAINLTKSDLNTTTGSSRSTSPISLSSTENETEDNEPENTVQTTLPQSSSHFNYSAESVALNLLRRNADKIELLPEACELKWLVDETDTPQSLLPLPKGYKSLVSGESSENDSSRNVKSVAIPQPEETRLRGNSEWAPPRPTILLTLHPNLSMSAIMKLQKYNCSGCGMKVEQKYSSTFRYCWYLGRYFCTGCHTLKKTRIPQFILHKWDFSLYTVSNFSATLLESLKSDPVYYVLSINPDLFKVVKMANFRKYRIQLGYLKEYFDNCKCASELAEELKCIPNYYYSAGEMDLYSLDDIVNIKYSTGFPIQIKDFVSKGVFHVLNCELCKELGFNCEVCKKEEVIYPFHVNRISRCPSCKSCYHIKCFSPPPLPSMTDREKSRYAYAKVKKCPKCLRFAERKKNLEQA